MPTKNVCYETTCTYIEREREREGERGGGERENIHVGKEEKLRMLYTSTVTTVPSYVHVHTLYANMCAFILFYFFRCFTEA